MKSFNIVVCASGGGGNFRSLIKYQCDYGYHISLLIVDRECPAIKIAKENAEKNHISAEKYTAYCGNIIDDKTLVEQIGTGYDLLCANIVADVLIGMSGIFGGFIKDGGTLIVSGIIDQRKDEVLDRLKAEGFELIEIREKEDWVAASFRK